MQIRIWRPVTAREEEVTHAFHPACEESIDLSGKPCLHDAAFVLAWTMNESGYPGLGEQRTAYVCGEHLFKRADRIPFRYAGSAVISPVREV